MEKLHYWRLLKMENKILTAEDILQKLREKLEEDEKEKP
jgi:hypothetical protein